VDNLSSKISNLRCCGSPTLPHTSCPHFSLLPCSLLLYGPSHLITPCHMPSHALTRPHTSHTSHPHPLKPCLAAPALLIAAAVRPLRLREQPVHQSRPHSQPLHTFWRPEWRHWLLHASGWHRLLLLVH
jgi:hypothetical protein